MGDDKNQVKAPDDLVAPLADRLQIVLLSFHEQAIAEASDDAVKALASELAKVLATQICDASEASYRRGFSDALLYDQAEKSGVVQ